LKKRGIKKELPDKGSPEVLKTKVLITSYDILKSGSKSAPFHLRLSSPKLSYVP
jgi:hypothetical protein